MKLYGAIDLHSNNNVTVTGAVTLILRSGSAANLNIRCHREKRDRRQGARRLARDALEQDEGLRAARESS